MIEYKNTEFKVFGKESSSMIEKIQVERQEVVYVSFLIHFLQDTIY